MSERQGVLGAPDDSYEKLENTHDKLKVTSKTIDGKQENISRAAGFHIFDEVNAQIIKPGKSKKTVPINQYDLLDINYLSKGHYGTTFKAKWKTQDVVIKASKEGTTEDDFEELQVFKSLRPSPNVLSLIGVCHNFAHGRIKKPTLALVVAYQANGDLKKFARKFMKEHGVVNQFESVNIVLGMARGLAQLHENDMVHRDLALRNYLVSITGRILIADFGLSRRLDGTDDNLYYRLSVAEIPWRTNPLEIFDGEPFKKHCDIWAFGIAVWELFHPKLLPFTDINNSLQLCNLLRNDNFDFSLDYGDEKHVTYPELLEDVVDQCCQIDPAKRSTIFELIDVLTGKAGGVKRHKESKEMRFAKRQTIGLQTELHACISTKRYIEAETILDDLQQNAKSMKETFLQEINEDTDEIQRVKIEIYELQEELHELFYVKKEKLLEAQTIVDKLKRLEQYMEEQFGIQGPDVLQDDVELNIFFTKLVSPKNRRQSEEVDEYVSMCTSIGLYYESDLREYLELADVEDLKHDLFFMKSFHGRKLPKLLFKNDRRTVESVGKKMREMTTYLNKNPVKFQI